MHIVNNKKEMAGFFRAVIFCLRISWISAKGYTICGVTIQIINATLPFVTILLTKSLVDSLSNSSGLTNSTNLITLLIFIGIINLANVVLNKINEYTQTMQESLLQNHINIELIKKKLGMDMRYFDSPNYQDILHSVQRDVYALNSVVRNIFGFIGAAITLISSWALFAQENLLYAVIITLAMLPSVLANQKYTRLLYVWSLEQSPKERQLDYIEWIAGEKIFSSDIRLFRLKDMLTAKYLTIWKAHFSGKRKVLKNKTIVTVFLNLLPELCSIYILILLAEKIISGSHTVGDYPLYTGLLAQLTGGLYMVIQNGVSIYEDKLRIDTLQKFGEYPNYIADSVGLELAGPVSIEFENVSFMYPDTDSYILRNLQFKICVGEKICLVGINGSGKSTIIKLLLRFYDVSEGRILINDIDIRSYNLYSLRRQFSTLFQQYVNYSFSLRENITISDPDKQLNDHEILQTLHQAGADKILQNAPDGLETYITKFFSQQGMELSGGQSQKIALARALYRSCSVIIFDEPSASLDPEAEHQMFHNISRLWEGNTALYTSHRLSAVHLADRIILLKNGKITEQGTHKELMVLGGEYARLYHLQADKYDTKS
ncbi:ABC transporter ATP-binding protein [Paenibacillus albidus]|uniref:ABC transporter ATP-binding protein n=1 Tax=Paenibacillus albidus TaxID=2041023 RepID=UPI001BE621E2|nr:ABC transporter ATP-binding protein [Paenibacillus albidus]MBT2290005.1 ABC transporter ATP-binding protein [Paenibacillus albidus]